MATIHIQFSDDTPDQELQGMESHNLIQIARAIWTEKPNVKLVLAQDGDPELLSSWTEVPAEGQCWQPNLREMRRWGMGDDLTDDTTEIE